MIRENNTRVQYNENPKLEDLIYERNCLAYEVLAYSLKQLGNNVIAKVHHYSEDGNLSQVYSELVSPEVSMIQLVTTLKHQHPDTFGDPGRRPEKNHVFYFLDSSNTAITRLIELKDTLRDVLAEAKRANLHIAVTTVSDDELRRMQGFEPGIVLCLPVNQYNRTMFAPFFVVVSKNSKLEQVREAILDKIMGFTWRYDYGPDELREVDFETKANFIAYTCEYKASRR